MRKENEEVKFKPVKVETKKVVRVIDHEKSAFDSVSNSDQEIEDKATEQITREMFKGSSQIERFVKKIGYSGKQIVVDRVANNFRTLFQGMHFIYELFHLEKILTILKQNKYLSSAKKILEGKAKKLEKIAFMKKGFQFKDLCYNIELNVKEMSKSRLLSQKFLLNKIPDNFLLINHEKFCEKKERIIQKALLGHKKAKVNVKPNTDSGGNLLQFKLLDIEKKEVKMESDKIEVKPKKNILSYLSELTQKKGIQEEIEKKEKDERIRKKILEQQRMGYNVHHEEHYPNVPQEQQYYEHEQHYPYQDYNHYMSHEQQYVDYPPHSDIKDEYANYEDNSLDKRQYNYPPMQFQQNLPFPTEPHVQMAYMKNPEIIQSETKPEQKTDEDEYDPLLI